MTDDTTPTTLPPIFWHPDDVTLLREAVKIRDGNVRTVQAIDERMFWCGMTASALVLLGDAEVDVIDLAYAWRSRGVRRDAPEDRAFQRMADGVIDGWESWLAAQSAHPTSACMICERVWFDEFPPTTGVSHVSGIKLCSDGCVAAWKFQQATRAMLNDSEGHDDE